MPNIDSPFETSIADLHGPDWTKRCDAARMLGQSGDPRAVEALLPDLRNSDWRVRRNAAQALGALKSRRAIPGLLEALKDRTATVRERAAVALGRIKDPGTIPALLEAVIEEKGGSFHVNEGAYQAIRKFGKKAGPALIEALKVKQNTYLVELLADSKYEARADFFITLASNSDPAMQRTALKALGKSKDPGAVEVLLEVLAKADLEMQVLAVQALTKLHAVEAAPKLLNLLLDDHLFGPRGGLYRAISDAFQEFSGIKKDIANTFPVDSKLSFSVGGAGMGLSGMMGMLGDEGFQRLNQFLADAEERVRKSSGTFGLTPEVFQAFADQTWKFGAILADGRDAKVEQVKLLLSLLKSDSPLGRTAAALSLPWYLDAGALEPLEQTVQDANAMVRSASAWAYAALKNMLPAGD